MFSQDLSCLDTVFKQFLCLGFGVVTRRLATRPESRHQPFDEVVVIVITERRLRKLSVRLSANHIVWNVC